MKIKKIKIFVFLFGTYQLFVPHVACSTSVQIEEIMALQHPADIIAYKKRAGGPHATKMDAAEITAFLQARDAYMAAQAGELEKSEQLLQIAQANLSTAQKSAAGSVLLLAIPTVIKETGQVIEQKTAESKVADKQKVKNITADQDVKKSERVKEKVSLEQEQKNKEKELQERQKQRQKEEELRKQKRLQEELEEQRKKDLQKKEEEQQAQQAAALAQQKEQEELEEEERKNKEKEAAAKKAQEAAHLAQAEADALARAEQLGAEKTQEEEAKLRDLEQRIKQLGLAQHAGLADQLLQLQDAIKHAKRKNSYLDAWRNYFYSDSLMQSKTLTKEQQEDYEQSKGLAGKKIEQFQKDVLKPLDVAVQVAQSIEQKFQEKYKSIKPLEKDREVNQLRKNRDVAIVMNMVIQQKHKVDNSAQLEQQLQHFQKKLAEDAGNVGYQELVKILKKDLEKYRVNKKIILEAKGKLKGYVDSYTLQGLAVSAASFVAPWLIGGQ